MRARVDSNCAGCGVCTSICPQVFDMGDDYIAKVLVDPIPAEAEECAVDAAETCPVAAIVIEK